MYLLCHSCTALLSLFSSFLLLCLCSFILFMYYSHCLFTVYCLQCMHLIHQDKFHVGEKSFLVMNLFLIVIMFVSVVIWWQVTHCGHLLTVEVTSRHTRVSAHALLLRVCDEIESGISHIAWQSCHTVQHCMTSCDHTRTHTHTHTRTHTLSLSLTFLSCQNRKKQPGHVIWFTFPVHSHLFFFFFFFFLCY